VLGGVAGFHRWLRENYVRNRGMLQIMGVLGTFWTRVLLGQKSLDHHMGNTIERYGK